ncbi:MAG: DUF2147 domain-containing protein [Paracoccaceae bacterium]|nr:DUF2147 domain-containing protein [Paracoccaceae bacterium]
MKRVALILALVATAPAFAGGEEGVWKTLPDKDGKSLLIEIKPCGKEVCGFIIGSQDEKGRPDPHYPHLGRRMIWGMVDNGDGSYDKGYIWGPAVDMTLSMKMRLKGDVLRVKGCFAGGLICKGQDWTRVR